MFNLMVFQPFLNGSNQLAIEICIYYDEVVLVLCAACAVITSAVRGRERLCA